MRTLIAAMPLWGVHAAPATSGPETAGHPAMAPGLHLRDVDLEPHDLVASRGDVVLVNFWATWCVPCVREMPSMQRLQDALSDRGFRVLAVNVAEPVGRLQRYLAVQGLTFTVLLDPESRVFHAWGVEALPTSFLIGRDGRVRHRIVGERDWDTDEIRAMVEALLAAPAQ